MIRFEDDEACNSQILVVGIGGAAFDVINTVAGWKLKDVNTAFIDTDKDTIKNTVSPEKFHLSQGLVKSLEDTSENSAFAKQGVVSELALFVNSLPQSEITFTVTGLGGATGTVITPYLIGLLKDRSQWVWSLLTLPFFFEGKPKIINSLKGFKKVNALSDASLVIPHDKIFKMVDKNVSMYEAFIPANKICTKLIGSLYRLTASSSRLNTGFSDIKNELLEKKSTAFGVGEASGTNMIQKAIDSAIMYSLLNKELLSGTRSLIVSILGGPDLKLKEVEKGIDYLRKFVPKGINISFGVTTEKSCKEKVQISIIALGLDNKMQDAFNNWDVSIASKDVHEKESITREPALVKSRFETTLKPLRRQRPISKPQQTTIDFKSSFKGRFDKSKPTMYEGEDLDIPTFLRRKK